jgi:hypothetical protein
MSILFGIIVLFGFFGLVWAIDALMDHLLLKAAMAVLDRLRTAFRGRYRSRSDAELYDRFRPKRKVP